VSSPFDSAPLRYGIGLLQAAVLAAVAVLFLDGTLRLAVLGFAVLELFVTPMILGRAASQ